MSNFILSKFLTITLIVFFIFSLFNLPFTLQQSHAYHSGTNIIVNTLGILDLPSGGNVTFVWTYPIPLAPVPGTLFIGTNSTDPIVNGLASASFNTIDESLTVNISTLPPGTYRAAMYTGFGPSLTIMSNIATFPVSSTSSPPPSGGLATLTTNHTSDNVTFTWDEIPGWTEGNPYTIEIHQGSESEPDHSCQALPVFIELPPAEPWLTSASGGSYTWHNTPTGHFKARLAPILPGDVVTFGNALSNCTQYFNGGQAITGFVTENPCIGGVCRTAIGDIPSSPISLASKILGIGVSIAGGLALILMVIGAIRVLTSSGEQQRLNAGREMIIAAVAGLLFLILSVVILQFIGFSILSGVPR